MDERIERVEAMLKKMIDCTVEAPGDVTISVTYFVGGVVFELVCAGKSGGELIGTKGRTARAIRTLLTNAGRVAAIQFVLDIRNAEPRGVEVAA